MEGKATANEKVYEEALVNATADGQGGQSDHVAPSALGCQGLG